MANALDVIGDFNDITREGAELVQEYANLSLSEPPSAEGYCFVDIGVRDTAVTSKILSEIMSWKTGVVWGIDALDFSNACKYPCWKFILGDSVDVGDAWDRTPNGIDFIFLDTDHTYITTHAELEVWWPLLKKGGWFGLHDTHSELAGVEVGEALADYFDLDELSTIVTDEIKIRAYPEVLHGMVFIEKR